MTGDIGEIEKGFGCRGSLTHSIIKGTLRISVNQEFITIFKLERAARSCARSRKVAS